MSFKFTFREITPEDTEILRILKLRNAYIFATDAQLETARRSGLTEQINSYHRGQLIKRHYPIEGIKDCTFASQEECDREFGGNWYYYFK